MSAIVCPTVNSYKRLAAGHRPEHVDIPLRRTLHVTHAQRDVIDAFNFNHGVTVAQGKTMRDAGFEPATSCV